MYTEEVIICVDSLQNVTGEFSRVQNLSYSKSKLTLDYLLKSGYKIVLKMISIATGLCHTFEPTDLVCDISLTFCYKEENRLVKLP